MNDEPKVYASVNGLPLVMYRESLASSLAEATDATANSKAGKNTDKLYISWNIDEAVARMIEEELDGVTTEVRLHEARIRAQIHPLDENPNLTKAETLAILEGKRLILARLAKMNDSKT
jgi:hypothetical protein